MGRAWRTRAEDGRRARSRRASRGRGESRKRTSTVPRNTGAAESAWRASVGPSRRILNGRRRPRAGEIVDEVHVPAVTRGTPPQRATGQRLVAVPIVGCWRPGVLCLGRRVFSAAYPKPVEQVPQRLKHLVNTLAADRAASRRLGFRRRRLARLPVGRAGPVHHRAAVPDRHLDRGNTGRRRITGLDTTSPARPGSPRLHRNQTPEPAPAAADGCRSSTRIDRHRRGPRRPSCGATSGSTRLVATRVVGTPGRPGRGGRGGVGRRGNPSAAAVQFSIVADLTPVPALPVLGAIAPALLLLLVVGARRRTAS